LYPVAEGPPLQSREFFLFKEKKMLGKFCMPVAQVALPM